MSFSHPKFGKLPAGERLRKIRQSPHYKKGAFQNLILKPMLTEGVGFFEVGKEYFFDKKIDITPSKPLPSLKTDLLNLPINQDILVWFGHSSYFIQLDGKRILVDPVFCGHASPFSFMVKAFEGTDVYTADDMPEIDYLFISHDHWDHLDYETLKKLKPKIKKVVCGLGTGGHLERWGYDSAIIYEKDWHESLVLDEGFMLHITPASHSAGRGVTMNKTLWVSFVLKSPTMTLFLGGDSGYCTHFKAIGEQFGPFDLIILENGQYDRKWIHNHLMPDEFLKVAYELKAKRILPVHSCKFALANHAWYEPLATLMKNNKIANMPIITPLIGQQVNLKDPHQTFSNWWEAGI